MKSYNYIIIYNYEKEIYTPMLTFKNNSDLNNEFYYL
jgi:hypothetical protein